MSKQIRLKLNDFIPSPPPEEGIHPMDIGPREFAVVRWDDWAPGDRRPWDTYSPSGWILLASSLPDRETLRLNCDSTHYLITDNADSILFQPLAQHLLHTGEADSHTLGMTLENRLEAIETVVVTVRRFLHDNIVPEPDETQAFEILLIIRELLTNAILHGNKNSFDKNPGIMLVYYPERKNRRIELLVIDNGPGYDFTGYLRKVRREGELRERHRGLLILKTFCDNIRVQPGCVSAEYRLKD